MHVACLAVVFAVCPAVNATLAPRFASAGELIITLLCDRTYIARVCNAFIRM